MVLLSSLPQELLRLILSQSCDFRSLLSAVASCRALHRAFHSFPKPLVDSVLHRELDIPNRPEVIQNIRALRLRDSGLSKQELKDARRQLLRRGPETALDWTLSEGISAVQLRNDVTHLSNIICKEYLDNLASHVGKGHEETPSKPELDLIQRALYRFEVYCNTFPPLGSYVLPTDEETEERVGFFESYPPWEIEQVGSVHESLFRLIAPVFNESVLHDISWGWDEVNYATDYDDGHVEWLLSRGLGYINKILHATSFDERWSLLGGRQILTNDCNWLYDIFDSYKNLFLRDRIGWMTRRPYTNKLDGMAANKSVPPVEKIWAWSHEGLYEESGDGRFRFGMAMEMHLRSLRACGYIFWDEKRLKRTGWFEQDSYELGLDVGQEIWKNSPSLRFQTRSSIIRSNLYREGKTGYWDGDVETTPIEPHQEWIVELHD